jgi:6-pyruvoyltetrahydropterin/6-carboxytetrahydropterin synthase
MLTVTKLFEFEAGHHLPNYNGDCHKQHGHTFKLEVTISSNTMDNFTGMIIDFKDLKSIVQENVISFLDHSYLNDVIDNPTSENIVLWIIQKLVDKMDHFILEKVRLYETSSSYCEWVR